MTSQWWPLIKVCACVCVCLHACAHAGIKFYFIKMADDYFFFFLILGFLFTFFSNENKFAFI